MATKSASKSIRFTQHFANLVKKKVASGRYESASEVVNEGLRLLEVRDREVQRIRGLIEHGCRQIDADDLHDGQAVFDEIRKMSGARRSKLVGLK